MNVQGSYPMRLLDREGLKEKGINHSYTQLWRMISAGKFPRPVTVAAGRVRSKSEIDDYIAARIAARDLETAGMTPSRRNEMDDEIPF